MAIKPTREVESTSHLRRIDITLTTDEPFPVPVSDGYSVYSALLGVLKEIDEEASSRIHNSELGSLHLSGLIGSFGGSDRPHHKTVLADEHYELSLGVVDPADEKIFQALVSGLVLEEANIELSHGQLSVEEFESSNTTHSELIDAASEYDDPTIEMQFRSPTCIEENGSVTTLFPHREAVFNSLLGKWNSTCPEELEIDIATSEFKCQIIEKPDPGQHGTYCLDTHSVLVSRGETEEGENRNIFSQGFTGTCGYAFKDAKESLQNAVTALALFAEYSGIGSSVARGCGSTEVLIKDD